VLHSDIDLLNPPAELEKQKHKLKRLVQSPNSFFMVRPRAPGGVKGAPTAGAAPAGAPGALARPPTPAPHPAGPPPQDVKCQGCFNM
jgi:hypothetical protein